MLSYFMNQRQIRGKEIVEKQNQIRRLNETHYEIKSQSRGIIHDVVGTEFGWSCSCEDHQFRKICCKHIHAVEISLAIRKQVKQKVVLDSVNIDSCISCKSENIIKRGIRKNKTHSIQRYSI